MMPPWKPEPGYGEFAGNRRLSEAQIALLERWRDEGMLEGDPARVPPLPAWSGRWQRGEPDLILQTTSFTLRPAGDDVYRNFVLPIDVAATRYVKAWEFLPGNPRVVHHATMQLDATGASRRLDAQDPQPGYEGMISHSVRSPDGFFLDWGPGHVPYVAPEGMAWPVRRGTDLVMMLHLRPDGREEPVQASLGLYFSDTPPTLTPTLVRLTKQNLDIPAGDSRYFVTDSFTLNAEVDVHTVQPHAHYLAREVKGYATLPDGSRKWMIYIRDWDFDWQGVYHYAAPVRLPAGTTLTMEYTYDNSSANARNPNRPPRRVTFGQRTSDEMAELWFQVVPRAAADRPMLARAIYEKLLHEEIVGHEQMLAADPANALLHDDAALLHAEAGDLQQTTAHFAEALRLRPDSPAAHYNVGMALLMQNRGADAERYLRQALTLQPAYALAHDGLGVALQGAGKLREALEHYREAVRLDPANANARTHLAALERQLAAPP
jgi:hypothetical protein